MKSTTACDDQLNPEPDEMGKPQGTTPVSSQLITMARIIEDLEADIERYVGINAKLATELANLAQQKPIKYLYRVTDCFGNDVLRDDPKGATILETIPLYTATLPAPHKGATHCDDCGLTWLDDGLNPLVCPYCKDAVPAPAVPAEWREVMSKLVGIVESSTKFHGCDDVTKQARALLQSAEPNNNAAADRLLEGGE